MSHWILMQEDLGGPGPIIASCRTFQECRTRGHEWLASHVNETRLFVRSELDGMTSVLTRRRLAKATHHKRCGRRAARRKS